MAIGRPGGGNIGSGKLKAKAKVAKPARRAAKPKSAKARASRKKRT